MGIAPKPLHDAKQLQTDYGRVVFMTAFMGTSCLRICPTSSFFGKILSRLNVVLKPVLQLRKPWQLMFMLFHMLLPLPFPLALGAGGVVCLCGEVMQSGSVSSEEQIFTGPHCVPTDVVVYACRPSRTTTLLLELFFHVCVGG